MKRDEIMYVIENRNTKPQHNLALEEYLCDKAAREGREFFMLWQNEPSIIVGRFQNTLEEINADYVRDHGVHVVRRNSGGGAVYHDLGNINYSFITEDRQKDFDFAFFTDPIIRALRSLGVNAELSGRNDIAIEGKKISGGAQFRHRGIMMHHGTLLFDSDLDVLSQALKVPEEKFRSKGVKSVRARVTNIRPYLPQAATAQDFIRLLEGQIEGLTPLALTEEERSEVQKRAEEKYSAWEWNYGSSPVFTERKKERFPWGGIEAFLQVENGVVKSCALHGDYFGSGDYGPLLSRIVGRPYTRAALSEALEGLDTHAIFAGSTAEDIKKLLLPGA